MRGLRHDQHLVLLRILEQDELPQLPNCIPSYTKTLSKHIAKEMPVTPLSVSPYYSAGVPGYMFLHAQFSKYSFLLLLNDSFHSC